jgi:hypothetical protein
LLRCGRTAGSSTSVAVATFARNDISNSWQL